MNYSDYWPEYPDYAEYASGESGHSPDVDPSRQAQLIITSTITCLGSVTNCVVLALLAFRRDVRTLPFVAVGLLALCDLVRNASAVLLIVGEGLSNWIFGDAVCKVTRYLHFCSSIISSWHLVLVIVTRYTWTVHGGCWLSRVRADRMVLFSLVAWLLVIVCSIPVVITYSVWQLPSDPPVALCIFQADIDRSRQLILGEAVVRFLLPFLVLAVTAVLAVYRCCQASQASVQTTKAVTIVTPVVFTCLQLPMHVLAVWITSGVSLEPRVLLWRQYADSLSYVSTVVNPCLQAFTTPEFKAVLYGMWCCAKRYNAMKAEKIARRKLQKQNNRANGQC